MHTPRQVFKFGGTSIGSLDALRLALQHVRAAGPGTAVVVSAMSGVTDQLLDAARSAERGDLQAADRAASDFAARHRALAEALLPEPGQIMTLIGQSVEELHAMCQSIAVLRELSPRTLDAVVARGERVLAQLFTAALVAGGAHAVYVDATEIIALTPLAGGLWPDMAAAAEAAARLLTPVLATGGVTICPGYIGRGPAGQTLTLGRGGSDFSAAILARALGAERVVLYKEVDGLMTADPRAVKDARVLGELHFREAAELAYYGAKILHPRTMIPLLAAPGRPAIPLFIKNTFNSRSTGTRIADDAASGAYPVKALTAVHGQALCAIEGNGMMGVPGIAGRTFAALSAAGHSVTMISQASSEASICFVLPQAEAESARAALDAAFAAERAARLIDNVRVEPGVALLAIVGLGMRGTPGVAARVFAALASRRVNVLAIAQGSSELNITVALREGDVAAALEALHREFQLDRQRALGDGAARETSVALLGFGQIGQALSLQLGAAAELQRREGRSLRCVALADRGGLRLMEAGFSAEELAIARAHKRAGNDASGGARRGGDLAGLAAELRGRLFSLPWRRPVLVDLTAEETAPLLLEALRQGFHVVLANKKPLAVPLVQFDALFAAAAEHGVHLRYEATVGAGLPVLDTIAKLREAGDAIERVEGCLSGTLGFLMQRLDDEAPFSQAVAEAHERGYTEPDPRDDLSGMDVARKGLILARTLGLRLELADVRVEPLFPAELSRPEPRAFIAALAELDGPLRERVRAARAAGRCLRYVATVDTRDGGAVSVGLREVAAASPAGRLRGTDNQIVFTTGRYRDNPLVVTGPGAGADVTAAGVLNDILAIARGA